MNELLAAFETYLRNLIAKEIDNDLANRDFGEIVRQNIPDRMIENAVQEAFDDADWSEIVGEHTHWDDYRLKDAVREAARDLEFTVEVH